MKHHHQETQQQQLQQQLQQQQTQQHLQGESEFDEDDGDDDEYEEEEEEYEDEEEEEEEEEEDDGEPEDEDDMKAPPDARGPRRRNAGTNGKGVNRGDGLVNFGNLTVTGKHIFVFSTVLTRSFFLDVPFSCLSYDFSTRSREYPYCCG